MALNGDQSSDIKDTKILDNKMDSGSGDPEKGRNPYEHSTGDKRVGGRIAPVLSHLSNYDFGSDDSGSDILGKQIEIRGWRCHSVPDLQLAKGVLIISGAHFEVQNHWSRRNHLELPRISSNRGTYTDVQPDCSSALL